MDNLENTKTKSREQFSTRLGFILVAAGCAVGLGNVWRFPYIVGEYGGAAFVVLYLIFLLVLGLPIMIVEFAVGRGSGKSVATAFKVLQPSSKWNWVGWWGGIGCVMLLMFYTTVCGWMLSYVTKSATGVFAGQNTDTVASVFAGMLANPGEMVFWMLVSVFIGFIVCTFGVQKGIEKVTKFMMTSLLGIMLVLAVVAIVLPGGMDGLKFYLVPDFAKLFQGATPADQMASFGEAVYAAMGQAFFTLSLGISSMSIFASYIGKDRSLTGEAMRVCGLDTSVALLAGLIIFPACFAFGVLPDSGPGLVFVTLPSVFNQMPGGQIWGTLFFIFMAFAALSTVIAVFENITSWIMDKWNVERFKACLCVFIGLSILSLPCALGTTLLSGVALPGIGDIQSILDFIVSNNMLPLGSLFFVLFVVSKSGWGYGNFLAEVNEGQGAKFPKWAFGWLKFGIPTLIVIVFVMGYAPKIAIWMGL